MSAYLLFLFPNTKLFHLMSSIFSKGCNKKNLYWHWWQEDTGKFDLKQNIFIDWSLLKRSIIFWIEFYMKVLNEAWTEGEQKLFFCRRLPHRWNENFILRKIAFTLLRMSQCAHNKNEKKETINIKFITQSISTVNSTNFSTLAHHFRVLMSFSWAV